MALPTESKARKGRPIFSGVLLFFPDAIAAVAQCSQVGSGQHHDDGSIWWDRSKSGDELDALARHLLEAGDIDTDGIRHSAKVAWRALANLQKEIEHEQAAGLRDPYEVHQYVARLREEDDDNRSYFTD